MTWAMPGYADVGFNGAEDIKTPVLDQLAAAGTIFNSAYVAHPFCGPSRMGLMTGRYPHEFGGAFNLPNSGHGIEEFNKEGVPASETLISKVLQDAGYFTGVSGKWHMGEQRAFHPNARGFDDFYGFLGGGHQYFPEQFQLAYERQVRAGNKHINDYVRPLEHNGKDVVETDYVTDALSREAVRFVGQAAEKEAPFFLYLAYNAPHSPLEAKAEDMAHFSHIADEKRRAYAGMVYAVDRGVAKVVESLKSAGEYDNSLIIFLSDNGGDEKLGADNGPLREGKGSAFEGGYRVPMFFHWPAKISAGKRVDFPVSALDFYPTFGGLAGAEIPPGKRLSGKDIWSDFIAGRNPREGGMIYALRHRQGFSDVGARQDQWKICRAYNTKWKLYNLDDDLSEENDLSMRHPERLRKMVTTAERWSRSHTKPRWFDSRKVTSQWQEADMPNYELTFKIESHSDKELSK
ncbi:MAG: arylsulfatase A-like enzyme [Verrucomicrobiales bacterium]|jgi:arylsulfatase A-like enzyme